MSSTILEKTRQLHEDIELYMQAIGYELDVTYKTPKEQICQAHRIDECLDKITQCKEKLARLYKDEEGQRKEEMDRLGSGNMWENFYSHLKSMQEYHTRLPGILADQPDAHISVQDPLERVSFSGDENYGKCLDLSELYRRYTNLKGATKKPYHDYVRSYFLFKESEPIKNAAYKQYLEDLWSYLVDFLKKSNPLFNLSQAIEEVEKKVEQTLKNEQFKGWTWIEQEERKREEQKKRERTKKKNNDDKMEVVEPKQDPLFCQACKKSFSKDTVFQNHIQSKKHLQIVEKQKKTENTYINLELRIFELATSLLEQQTSETVLALEKKLSRTWKEREEEIVMQEEEDQIPELDEDDDELTKSQIKTTIANYPIGWDGKPIPYWLYKLHGLGVEYRCEICGDHPYYGRKAYERHFQEWRHAHGMRCLGIPNSKSFHDITKINDALLLWEKIKRDTTTSNFRPEAEEEYEDREGNVFNRKTFEDLRRQGLI